ncbi:MAG: hypothetical protein HN712_02265 [Gemmatimonadetes bacterium]|jgi:histidinol phosphatase-like PHP family hydrolase|nr:hypothetical protein [Gemmatimonadota bacterium]MBT6143835.1 hypothetical protein [Gemmatimonadota bacterium]MBT7859100.1 hypothetical protein [Gemmatimonadota bacterium]
MTIPRVDTQIHASRYRTDGPKMDATVAASIDACVAQGITHAGILEHLGNWRHPVECLHDMMTEFRTLDPPIAVAMGMEVNTRDTDGTMDGTKEDRERVGLDFVLAESSSTPGEITSVEDFIEYDHRCRMAATAHDWIDVIVHPYTTQEKRLKRAGWEGDWSFDLIPEAFLDEWADALATHGTACEINTKNIAFFEEPKYLWFMKQLIERRVQIAIGSDAHHPDSIGTAEPIYSFCEQLGVPPDLIWWPLTS